MEKYLNDFMFFPQSLELSSAHSDDWRRDGRSPSPRGTFVRRCCPPMRGGMGGRRRQVIVDEVLIPTDAFWTQNQHSNWYLRARCPS